MKLLYLAAATTLPLMCQTASLTCDATADPVLVRSEGVAETMGLINIKCAALSPGTVAGGFTVILSVPVTNRKTGADTIDARMVAETPFGTQLISASPILVGGNTIIFNPFEFQLPASGETTFRISNIRGFAASSLRPITAFISTNGRSGIGIRNNPVTVGVPQRGLLAAAATTRVLCRSYTTPDVLSFISLYALSTSFSFRVTENHPAVFQAREPGAPNGQRILVRYSGLPPDARVFVPSAIVGTNGIEQTSVGEFGVPVSGGIYGPGSNSLLMSFVSGTDADGAGGNPVALPQSIPFNGVSEVQLSGGAGTAAFEILDTTTFASESAHIPSFVLLPENSRYNGVVASASVSFGPISRTTAASINAPVPRFNDPAPPNDCSVLRDCNASYFPKLGVRAPNLAFEHIQYTRTFASRYITINNESGGVLRWTTTVTYKKGQNWLEPDPPSGVQNASINLRLRPEGLEPGFYEATFRIEAGNAGAAVYPVTLTVLPAPGGPLPPPEIPEDPRTPKFWTVGNAANQAIPEIVPGSLAAMDGVNLNGSNLLVMVGGINSKVVSQASDHVTFVVPEELGGQPEAEIRVEANKLLSPIVKVKLADAAPAILTNGVLNGDGRLNSRENPAKVGEELQIFASGLPVAIPGRITARIHDRDITLPEYAGKSPGLDGIQRVSILVPDELPAMDTEVFVCGASGVTGLNRACSLGYRVWITR